MGPAPPPPPTPPPPRAPETRSKKVGMLFSLLAANRVHGDDLPHGRDQDFSLCLTMLDPLRLVLSGEGVWGWQVAAVGQAHIILMVGLGSFFLGGRVAMASASEDLWGCGS